MSNAKEFEENATLGTNGADPTLKHPTEQADTQSSSRSIHPWHTGAHRVTSPVGSSLDITLRKDYPTLIHTDSSFCKQLIGNNIFTYEGVTHIKKGMFLSGSYKLSYIHIYSPRVQNC